MRRYYIDMDGTLAKWQNVEFEELYEEGFFRNMKPNSKVIDAICNLHEKTLWTDVEIHILSAYLTDSKYAIEEKKEWLKEYLPFIEEDHYILVPYGEDKSSYIKGGISPNDILLDDYTHNLLDWENSGGTAIKLLNGVNHTKGTWKGQMIDMNNISEYELFFVNSYISKSKDFYKLKFLLSNEILFDMEYEIDKYMNDIIENDDNFTMAVRWYEGLVSTNDFLKELLENRFEVEPVPEHMIFDEPGENYFIWDYSECDCVTYNDGDGEMVATFRTKEEAKEYKNEVIYRLLGYDKENTITYENNQQESLLKKAPISDELVKGEDIER